MLGTARSLGLALLVACTRSAQPAPPASAVAPPSPPPAQEASAPAPSPPSVSRGPAAPPVVVEPTVLTDAQSQQDAKLAPLARSIVDAYPSWNGFFSSLVASWSPDGKRILFGSVRDGSPQIYAGDPARPAAPPTAITSGSERAIWASYTPDGKYILFLRDTRDDENHHIWRLDADGTNPVDLTPAPGRHRQEPQPRATLPTS